MFIHDTAIVDRDAVIGNSRIWDHANVQAGSVIGDNCNIGGCVFIEGGAYVGDWCTVKNGVQLWSGVTLEDYVFVGPNATFTNDRIPRSHPDLRTPTHKWKPTVVQEGATVGANATIICGVSIGKYAFVAAGAVVTRDVPDFAFVKGVPARLQNYVCRCGTGLSTSSIARSSVGITECPECGRTFGVKLGTRCEVREIFPE